MGEVHLWICRPSLGVSAEVVDAWLAISCESERSRYRRYVSTAARHRFLAARALLRTTLSHYAGVRPQDWRFRIGPWGRPEVESPRVGGSAHCNLAHTDGLVVCVAARKPEVGVDVEPRTRRGSFIDLARRYFSAAESADIEAAPKGERRQRFLAYWTLKEAYFKARGLGLAAGLDRPRFRLGESQLRFSIDSSFDDRGGDWSFWLARPTDEHLLAIAARGQGGRPRLVSREVLPLVGEPTAIDPRVVAQTG